MQYLLLIYANEAASAKERAASAASEGKMMEDYRIFTQSIIEGGQFKAGDAWTFEPPPRFACATARL